MYPKEEIIKHFRQTIKELYGDRLAKIVLYGSYARGDFHEEWDMDFLVVLKDEEISVSKELKRMNKAVLDLMLKFNLVISLVPTTLQRFQEEKNPFFFNVLEEGIEVGKMK